MGRFRFLRSAFREDGVLLVACTAMIVFGAWLRIHDLGFPPRFAFDEHHFVPNARNYLAGHADTNDHPPLGKLIMALAIRLLGDQPAAWRVTSLCFGLLAILLAALLASWAFRDRRAAFIAAAMVAVDGFFISYSRSALLDMTLTTLCLASFVVLFRARAAWAQGIAAILLGSACAVKFSPIGFVPLLAIFCVVLGRSWLKWIVPVLVPATYTAWFSLGLAISKRPSGVSAVFSTTWHLIQHHVGLTEWKNPLCSHWYQWFLPTRPILMRFDEIADGRVRAATSLGNPLLWWLVDVVIFATAAQALGAIVTLLRRRGFSWADVRGMFDSPRVRRFALALLWLVPVAPWMISKRDSYIYHYLPAYLFGVILASGAIAALYRERRLWGLLLLLVIGEVSAYYAPIWGQLPITKSGYEQRLFAKGWR